MRPFADRAVLLSGKRPIERNWPHRKPSAAEIAAHVAGGGNIGVKAGDGLVILDFDCDVAEREMLAELGQLTATVETGRGRHHYYVRVEAGVAATLSAKLIWKGQTVGECQRTGAQQCVAPDSVHPDTGRPYRWLVDNPEALPELPERWIAHLTKVPDYIKDGDTRGHEADGGEWKGESAEYIIAQALAQPGAKVSRNGVHFQCRGCKLMGRDRSMDNGVVFIPSGKFTCATDREAHRSHIANQLRLGLIENMPGYVDPKDAGFFDPYENATLQTIDPYENAPLEEENMPRRTRRARRSAALVEKR